MKPVPPAFQKMAAQQGQAEACLRAIGQARGYYKRNEQVLLTLPCRQRLRVLSRAVQATKWTGSVRTCSPVRFARELFGRIQSTVRSWCTWLLCGEGPGDSHTSDHTIPIALDTLISQPRSGDYEGVMIVDIGCVRSVAGRAWIEREVSIRKQLNKHVWVERTADWFRFGDGVRRLSRCRVHVEVSVKGHVGLLAVNMIDCPCPPLLSKAVCNTLGMCIDCEANVCEIRRVGERRCPLACFHGRALNACCALMVTSRVILPGLT